MFVGCITIWSGAIVDIPADYQICDGSNGTPDLRDRFVIGSQGNLAVGATGGADSHTHNFTSDGHTHEIDAGNDIESGGEKSKTTDNNQCTGTTDATNNLPPYFALAFIMRMT